MRTDAKDATMPVPRPLDPPCGFLAVELERRRRRNPLYSLRAFARSLGLSPTTLSQVLTGKRQLSRRSALSVGAKLGMDPGATNRLLIRLGHRPERELLEREFRPISDEAFSMISDWYYFALHSLCKMPGVRPDPEEIARRLPVTVEEARQAVERLVRIGLLEVRGGCLRATAGTPSTRRDVPSAAVRRYHRETLQLAGESLEGVPVGLRDVSSITFPADLAKLPQAKELILAFKRDLARLMETDGASEVYALAVQLFPLTLPGSGAGGGAHAI
jgi:hypothetical protein